MNQKEALSHDTKPIPVTIITGFLGAGKSTLLNSIIDHFGLNSSYKRKIGVIINEFGTVGIDTDIIKTDENYKVDVSNGCACCVVRTDLEQGIKELMERVTDLDHIIIEASGLAQPGPIAQTFMHNISLKKETYLDAIICVVDTVNFVSNWDQFVTLKEQIDSSDFLVLTKREENEEIAAKSFEILQKTKPDAVMLYFNPSKPKNLEILLDTRDFGLNSVSNGSRIESEDAHTEADDHIESYEHTHEHFDEVLFTTEHVLDPNKLDKVFLSSELDNVIRAKGFFNLAGQDSQSFLFQLVGHGRQLSPFGERKNSSTLVLIGKDLNSQKILNLLNDCAVVGS